MTEAQNTQQQAHSEDAGETPQVQTVQEQAFTAETQEIDHGEVHELSDAQSDEEIVVKHIESLEAELAAAKDRALRSMADAENTRRRAQKDIDDARTYGGSKLANDLLPVLDNLDRALDAATEDMRTQAKDFFEGVELTRRELLNAFSKHKIEMIKPEKGDKFDPNLHQAMFEAPVPDTENGSIIEVMQVGFTISGRLLRPAFVGVAKS